MKDGMSSGARGLILGRIWEVLRERPGAAAEYQLIQRNSRQAATLDRAARADLFADRLIDYQVGVYRCTRHALPRAIGDTLAVRGKSRLLVPPDLPREWLPRTVEAVPDAGLTNADLDLSDGVLTACTVAIASTGTIVLRHGAGEGRRALTLLPDYHLCVVFGEQIVQTVPEAVRRIAELKAELVTTISGPSATADIEMTRVRGVHGPRNMDVVIVG